MKKRQVLISESARDDFGHLADPLQKRLKKSLLSLGEDPLTGRSGIDIKKLEGSFNPPLYRLRVGDYRAVYSFDDKEVKVTSLFHRSKGYRRVD